MFLLVPGRICVAMLKVKEIEGRAPSEGVFFYSCVFCLLPVRGGAYSGFSETSS